MNKKPIILAVDNNPADLRLFVNTLTPEGYTVLPADSGELALAAVAFNLPDLILLDLRMEGLDGVEVCRRLKTDELTRHIPIILISAFSDVKEWLDILKIGASDYIAKPFHSEELITRVKTHLALSQANLELKRQATALIESNDQLRSEVAKRQQGEEEIRKMNRIFSAILDNAGALVSMMDANQDFIFWNRGAENITGYKADEVIGGKGVLETIYPDEEYRLKVAALRKDVIQGKPMDDLQLEVRTKSGEIRTISFYSRGVKDEQGAPSGMVNIGIDITERKKAEQAVDKLQDQLNQAQKMEYVGRLAGGVAHDFNNMLGVILGNTELALDQVENESPILETLMEIQKAAERSADLTRQLLAFARKQPVIPKVIDLNETVEGALKMLRRLIGEDIALSWMPSAGLWPVNMDPSQIDQMLANLCVNARDAISGVGTVSIQTSTASFDDDYCKENMNYSPGNYVLLSVSDNGLGMTEEILAHLFEPFFTTKEIGKGTGLGLATVYGVVKQNNGFINVMSKPEKGTIFNIYLPRFAGPFDQPQSDKQMVPLACGHETILIVEDEPSILTLAATMLKRAGYVVLTASTPAQAIALTENHQDSIDLLITDVVMPEMNGRDLALKILSLYPNLKRLFMSGYTADVIAHQGVLDDGVHFIQKPFSKQLLVSTVREILDDSV